MGVHKLPPRRKKLLQVDAIIARADADRAVILQPPPTQHSHAGWSWEDGNDPYLNPA